MAGVGAMVVDADALDWLDAVAVGVLDVSDDGTGGAVGLGAAVPVAGTVGADAGPGDAAADATDAGETTSNDAVNAATTRADTVRLTPTARPDQRPSRMARRN
jgi:hypothetical protein